jgi:pyridoxine 4-dehydrogenase
LDKPKGRVLEVHYEQERISPGRIVQRHAGAYRASTQNCPYRFRQNRYSFADREWDYVVDYCERSGIAFIPWFPLGAGKVAGDVLNRIAQAHHSSPTQIALAWLLQRSPIMLPIPGTSSIEHLEENVASASVRLFDEDYRMLAKVPKLIASR